MKTLQALNFLKISKKNLNPKSLNKISLKIFSNETKAQVDMNNFHSSQSQHFGEKLIVVDENDKAIDTITKLDGKN